MSNIISTIAPVAAIDNSNLRPEWLRIPSATHVSGISRSGLYELIESGELKSVCLRKRGAKKGIRLISYDSLMSVIAQAEGSSK